MHSNQTPLYINIIAVILPIAKLIKIIGTTAFQASLMPITWQLLSNCLGNRLSMRMSNSSYQALLSLS